MKNKIQRFFGNKAFVLSVLAIIVPMIIQNGITNFVGLLDNVMVGRVGTEQMSGVSLSNQLMFVFNLCVFGGLSGVGIFTAQFFGQKNVQGIQDTFRIKLYLALILAALGTVIFALFGRQLIQLFLKKEDTTGDVALTLDSGVGYLRVMLLGLLPFAVSATYASTLRECGETRVPMISGLIAVFVNLCLNYVLIYGHFGAPALGVVGAAVATVISRYVEMGILILTAHLSSGTKFVWVRGAFRSLKVPLSLLKNVIIRGTPLLFNEALWSAGMSIITQCYSTRGLIAIAALNISSTVSNLFNTLYFSLGMAAAIIVGQRLGAGEMEEAKDADKKVIHLSLAMSCVVAGLMLAVAPFIPKIYNTSDEVRSLATAMLMITAFCTPLYSYCNVAYFTLRCGGKTLITFLFDCGFLYGAAIPLAFCLSRFTDFPIRTLFLCCQLIDLLKCVIGFIMLRSNVWVHNIVAGQKT